MARLTRSFWACLVSSVLLLGLLLFIKLGLAEGQCLFWRRTGLLCPLCGMTRSLEATFRLQVGRAFLHHPFGPLLVLVLTLHSSLLVTRNWRKALAAWMENHDTVCRAAATVLSGLFVLYGLGRMLWDLN